MICQAVAKKTKIPDSSVYGYKTRLSILTGNLFCYLLPGSTNQGYLFLVAESVVFPLQTNRSRVQMELSRDRLFSAWLFCIRVRCAHVSTRLNKGSGPLLQKDFSNQSRGESTLKILKIFEATSISLLPFNFL